MSAIVIARPRTDEELRDKYDRTNGTGSWDRATAAVEDWKIHEPRIPEPVRRTGVRHPLAVRTFQEFIHADFPTVEWRVDHLLPGVGTGLILAPEKAGKSLLALQACISIAAGVPFLGRDVIPCPTLLVEEEGSPRAHQNRFLTQGAKLGVLAKPDLPFYVLLREQVRLDDPESMALLGEVIRERGIKFMAIGPLSQVTSLQDENKSTEINRVMKTLNELATEHQLLVLCGHHARKPDQRNGPPKSVRSFFDGSRGSNALVGAVDVGLGISRDPEEEDGWINVLSRDFTSFRMHITFDPQSLCVWPTEAPEKDVKAPPAAVLRLLEELGPLGATDVMAHLDISRGTADERLARLKVDGLVEPFRDGHRILFRATQAQAIAAGDSDRS